jgi:hypothetical protein
VASVACGLSYPLNGMIKERSSALIALIAVSFFALAFTGCETVGALPSSKQPEDSFSHITRVTYQPGDKGTSVKVYGTGRFEHTSYKLANPLRIAVEIPNVLLDFEPKRVRLNNSAIIFLDVVRFKKVNSVRIELELLTDAGYTITQKKNYLELLVANSPTSTSGKRALPPETAGRSFEKDETIARLQENIAILEQEKIAGLNTQRQLEEENRVLKESLEEASIQLEEAGGKATALDARVVFMEGKLSDIQDKMAVDSAAPEIIPAPLAAEAAKETLVAPQAAQHTLVALTEVEIEEVMAGWLEAWNSKDIDAYSDFYSDDFETDTMDRETWLRDKGFKFARRGEINVTAIEIEYSLTVDGAVVIFEQRYESRSYRDIGLKIISLTKRSGSWKIVSESWKPL